MKARIEKKLSKRLVQIDPDGYRHAWISDSEPTELAYAQGSRVANIYCIGGGCDYWGEGQDAYTVWEDFKRNWMWSSVFEHYPEGHKNEFIPDTTGFRPTTRNLLKLAAREAAKAKVLTPNTQPTHSRL